MYVSIKSIRRMTQDAKKLKGKTPMAAQINLETLTELRIQYSIYSAALRGHNNVSLMFYPKYYFDKNLKAILISCEKQLKDFKFTIEDKHQCTGELYYKVRIEW